LGRELERKREVLNRLRRKRRPGLAAKNARGAKSGVEKAGGGAMRREHRAEPKRSTSLAKKDPLA
jgi:hypothetical protein